MQMYPGAGYKEQHHYKVEKDDYVYSDDFHCNSNSGPAMQMKRPDSEFKHNYKHSDHQYTTANHHNNHGKIGPNMHMMMKPSDHHNNHGKMGPNTHMMMKPADHDKQHSFGGYFGPNKQGMDYSETIYEQEEKQFHVDKYDNNNNFAGHQNYGKLNYGGPRGGGYMDQHNYGGNGGYYSDDRKKVPAVWDCKGMDD